MTEQKGIYEPKKVWQNQLETWFENNLYYVRIFKDFVLISPKGKSGKSDKELTIYSTGRVTIEENGKEYGLKLCTNRSNRNKHINLLE